MDERTKRAIESIENRRLGLDDTLSFSCTHCGGCCVHQEELLLNPLDLFRMAKELGITIEQWMEQYGECYIGEDSRIPVVRISPQGETRRCPLLKNNKCSVHQAKPSVCRLYPLGRSLKYETDEQGKPDKEKAEVLYFHSGCFCGSQTGHQTVREWLEEFHLLEDEPFFIQWSRVVADTSVFLRNMEKTLTKPSVMNMAWEIVYVLMYLLYNTQEEFLPQFHNNLERLRKIFAEIERVGGDVYGRGV